MTSEVRVAERSELPWVAENFRRMWIDTGLSPDAIGPDWRERTEEFIDTALREREGRAFVATLEDRLVGSAVCQLFEGLYPSIVRSPLRKSGYIWGVYVERDARRRGVATALTRAAIDYLREIRCNRVLLHASQQGRPVYEGLGFVATNERALELSAAGPARAGR